MRFIPLIALCLLAHGAQESLSQILPATSSRGHSVKDVRISDEGGYLSEKGRRDTLHVLDRLKTNEPKECCKSPGCEFPQVGVYIARASEAVPSDALAAAREIHDRWGVGQKDCDNGVLFYLHPKGRKYGFSTGRGVKDSLTDSDLESYADAMKPFLRSQDYSRAVLTCTTKIVDHLFIVSSERSFWSYLLMPLYWLYSIFGDLTWITLLVLGVFGISSVVERRKSERRRQARLERTRRLHEQFANGEQVPLQQTTCAICLEDLNRPRDQETLPCRHEFHRQCLEKWLEYKNVCPMCRLPPDRDNDFHDGGDDGDNHGGDGGGGGGCNVQRRRGFFLDQDLIFFQRRHMDTHLWQPVPAPTSQSSGSSGGSFGGGSSFGGGGISGSW